MKAKDEELESLKAQLKFKEEELEKRQNALQNVMNEVQHFAKVKYYEKYVFFLIQKAKVS